MTEDTADSNRLGEYLRARRALVTPEHAGIPAGAHRRVTGLRREEVALLAGISADYYLRLERGRDKNPSPQVLQALARVLRLDDVEGDYLLAMAAPKPRVPRRRRVRAERVPARLHDLLAAVNIPAFVEGRYFDVLAANAVAEALSPRLAIGHNRLRDLVLDPEEREFHHDWERAVDDFIAAFRMSIDHEEHDVRAAELVGQLSLASERFRVRWARHDIRQLRGDTADFTHPRVGRLTLHRDKLPVEGVTLVLYYAEPHSASADKLALLGALNTDVARPPQRRLAQNDDQVARGC